MILLSVTESQTVAAEKLVARWATVSDREYAARRKTSRAAHNSLLARAMLRPLLTIGGHDVQARILSEGRGKPYIENGPHISITHSRGMVACALCADFPIGIDIEYHRRRDFAKLAAYAFGPGEVKAVAAQGAAAFYHIWTKREAIAKISGASVFSGMNGKDIDFRRWQVYYRAPQKDYTLAVAVENAAMPLESMLKWVDATE